MIRRASLPLALLLAAWPSGPARAQTQVQQDFAASSRVALRIWVPTGRVRLRTWDHDSVQVRGTAAAGSSYFGGGGGTGAKLGVEAKNRLDGSLAEADLLVTVPAGARVWIKMTTGVVEASGTAGELEVITVGGSVLVDRARGVVAVEAIDAAVTLREVTGAIRVRNGGGAVRCEEVRGTMTVATIGGEVSIIGRLLDEGRIETIGGRITLRGAVSPKGFFDVQSHDGPIELALARGTVVDAQSRGTVRNALAKGAGAAAPGGRVTARSFRGTINAVPATGIGGKQGHPIP